MSFFDILGTLLIKPLELIFEVIYALSQRLLGDPALSVVALSLFMNLLVLPLYRRADELQEEEKQTEMRLKKGVDHIKKTFRGDERMLMLQTYYRQNGYKPTYVLKGAASLLLEIPFFIAAYRFLSNPKLLGGVSLGPISDMGAPDGLIHIAGLTVNLLPFIMTAVNLVSCVIFTRDSLTKTKIQLYCMALFFLVFLYSSPSGLVFYWTLNNLFSLAKTFVTKVKGAYTALRYFCSAAGIGVLVYGLFFYGALSPLRVLLFVAAAAALEMPLAMPYIKKLLGHMSRGVSVHSDGRLFFACALYLAVFTGLLIPTTIIKASPEEFVDISLFYHPAWYALSSFCLALGTFVIWAGIFYRMAGEGARTLFDRASLVLAGVVTVDYMFFGRKLGNLSSLLTYDGGMSFERSEKLLNLAVLVLTGAVLLFAAHLLKKKASSAVCVCTAALMCMSCINTVGVFRSVSDIARTQSESSPHFTLKKNGKNVVVIMLDRAMNVYLPYIFNEIPELKSRLDGFTWYDNVISFGQNTNFCTPSLFGGYEYTPAKINARVNESLKDKQNEALSVMPVLFSREGASVTVFDPPYAGYKLIPDLSIYDKYEGISAFITKGHFSDPSIKKSVIRSNKRNFFCFGITKASPLLLQNVLYNNGSYNSSSKKEEAGTGWQQTYDGDLYTADGLYSNFMDSYEVLEQMKNMTRIEDTDGLSFLMMSNETTHDPMLLQEGEFEPKKHVDNRKYAEEHPDRFVYDGKTLKVDSVATMANYQANIASLMRLCDWFDYLREEGIYDNTRIILVSDHGFNFNQREDMLLDDGIDLEGFYPLLLVKDFNAEGFKCDSTFMTNADVPTLAVSGVIDSPVNPFTGKKIDWGDKTAHDQYALHSWNWSVDTNNGNAFTPCRWYRVHGDMRLKESWTLVAEDAVLCEEK